MNQTGRAVLLLVVALILHLAEEVGTGFRKKLPLGEMPLGVFVGINVALYAFCFSTLFLSIAGNPWSIPLAWAFAIAMGLNALGHIGMMVLRKGYFPGGVTAFLLLLAGIYLVVILSD
ncbi:MAG: HXXEE domain-containing protein [Anaerolineae bacterium]|nr:HXXEE domain-containing protein [Anaerolineae bacterium]